MQNINIHSNRPKRSVQSLIQNSSIENQQHVVNFEILELKKAYNQTYKSFNNKIQNLEAQLTKYKEKCKKLEDANVSLAEKNLQFQTKNQQYSQMKHFCQKMKRKVLYVQGKYQKLMQNRTIATQGYEENQKQILYENWVVLNNLSGQKKKVDKNQVYKEISQLINLKIKDFTKQIKTHPMSRDVQTKLQNFLEELVYITPLSGSNPIQNINFKQRFVGKISRKQTQNVIISDQQGWKDLSKSIQKLKISNQNTHDHTTPQKNQKLLNQQSSKKPGFKSRSPLNYENNPNLQKDLSLSPDTKTKPRIFINN